MSCRCVLRSVILIDPILLRPSNFNVNKLRTIHHFRPPPPLLSLSCSRNETPSSHHHPHDSVPKDISEVSEAEGSVVGDNVAHQSTFEWRDLDRKVNLYPMVRGFTAIGTGGDDFVQAMVVAVESVIQQPIPQGHVKQKLSSGGKYVSVNIGPIQVVSGEQVQAVYNAMRRDDRMKYLL